MIHADAHLVDYFRVFTQCKGGLEDGRTGGPRPTDRDDFDLNQAFFDAHVPFAELDSLTFRAGRQELAYGSSRLISAREAPNVRLSFDGVKAILNLGDWRGGALARKPPRTKKTGEGRGGEEGRSPGGADSLKKKKKSDCVTVRA